MTKWNKFLTEGELKTVGVVACLNDKQQFLVIRRSDIDDRKGQWTIPGGHNTEVKVNKPNPKTGEIEHDAWKWLTINKIKDLDNSEIPIYLLEKALKIAGFDKNE